MCAKTATTYALRQAVFVIVALIEATEFVIGSTRIYAMLFQIASIAMVGDRNEILRCAGFLCFDLLANGHRIWHLGKEIYKRLVSDGTNNAE